MTRGRYSGAATTHTTRALLLKRVDYGESDLVVSLFTEELGRVSALARGARKSKKRFAGSLEPLHTLTVRVDERVRADLLVLREASIARARVGLTQDLDRMEAAGRALTWLRRAAPPRTPEPHAWAVVESLLDALDVRGDRSARLYLAEAGLGLLEAFGWGLELERCVRCGKSCPEGQAALVDPARGGLICRACGGARLRVEGPTRGRLVRTIHGHGQTLAAADEDTALELVDRALRAHMGVE